MVVLFHRLMNISLTYVLYLLDYFDDHLVLHSFPTRRSSDLGDHLGIEGAAGANLGDPLLLLGGERRRVVLVKAQIDRKSTRLNSSHANISYAVFCLKKKNNSEYHDVVYYVLSNTSAHLSD